MAFEIFNKKKSDSKKPARNIRKGSKEKETDKKKKDLELDLKKFSFAERWEDERFRSSIGIVTIGLSLFFFISIISSFFTGNNDILLVTSEVVEEGLSAVNYAGILGAYVGYFLVYKTFGFGTLILPFIMFLLGVRWLTGKNFIQKLYRRFLYRNFYSLFDRPN